MGFHHRQNLLGTSGKRLMLSPQRAPEGERSLAISSKMLEVSPKATLEWEHKKIINLSKNEIMSIFPPCIGC